MWGNNFENMKKSQRDAPLASTMEEIPHCDLSLTLLGFIWQLSIRLLPVLTGGRKWEDTIGDL